MGTSESKFRITKTEKNGNPWIGFCTVVQINEITSTLTMPNGEQCDYIRLDNKIKIVSGENKGIYKLENITHI